MMRLTVITGTLALTAVLINGCKPASQATSSGQQDAYYEDLSALRPKISLPETDIQKETSVSNRSNERIERFVEPVYTVNKKVDTVLDSIDRFYLARGYVDGYTIQVHAGTKRDEALNVKKNMMLYLPQFETEIQYNQPTFRVKTGKYFSLLEAQKDFLTIKRYFPSAILVPDKIPVVK